MKSIKPGRGPSFMGGIGSAVAVVFGIAWTFATVSMGAPALFPIFGILFVLLGIAQAAYNFKNATGENRYSSFDIIDDEEEPDPFNARFSAHERQSTGIRGGFCPYCGAKAESSFEFCRQCGKKLP